LVDPLENPTCAPFPPVTFFRDLSVACFLMPFPSWLNRWPYLLPDPALSQCRNRSALPRSSAPSLCFGGLSYLLLHRFPVSAASLFLSFLLLRCEPIPDPSLLSFSCWTSPLFLDASAEAFRPLFLCPGFLVILFLFRPSPQLPGIQLPPLEEKPLVHRPIC